MHLRARAWPQKLVTKKRATLFTPIDGGFVGNGGNGCSVNAVNAWSVLSRTRMKQEDFAGCICAVA